MNTIALTIAAVCTLGAVLCIAAYHLSLKREVRVSSLRTWHVEAGVVAAVLATVAIVTDGGWREWLGAGAVLLSFAHAQISARFAEKEAVKAKPDVECHRMSGRYFAAREIAWFAYFATGRCWSALVGCVVFLMYGPWRKWWRNRHPLDFPCAKCGRPIACTEGCCAIVVALPPEQALVHDGCAMNDEERAAYTTAIVPEERGNAMRRMRERVNREYDAVFGRSKSTAPSEEQPQ